MTRPAPSGITECDDYVNVVWALESCTAFPKESLDMLKAMTDEAMYEWQAIHPDHPVYLREGCKAGGAWLDR